MQKWITIILAFQPLFLAAQEYTSLSKKAIKHYETALQFFNASNNREAIDELKKAIGADASFIEAYLLLAEVYTEQGQQGQVIETYMGAISIDSSFFPPAYYNLADAELSSGKYKEALGHFNTFLKFADTAGNLKEKARKKVNNCQFALEQTLHPVPFQLVRLSDSINTVYDEYWPSLTADENVLVFTTLIPKTLQRQSQLDTIQEDFFVSYSHEGEWSKSVSLGPPLNTPGNEGAQSVSPDGKLIYFTACNRPEGLGSCDIYFSKKTGNNWGKPVNLGAPVNTRTWEAQPSISPDGKSLYFASSRAGGQGGMDIWGCKLNENGTWGIPENMGSKINTPANEMSPFIHPDNQTLYFSSDGLPGMGKIDLFVCRRVNDSTWSEPENIGYPINTFRDEVGLIVNSTGNKALFSSNRLNSANKDLYEFELYEKARPHPVSYMKGSVYDADTKIPLEVRFELIDIEKDKIEMESFSDKNNGDFLVCLPSGRDYALNVSKKGYLFSSGHFALKEEHSNRDPYLVDIYLQPIKKGHKVILKNIFYETASYTLREESTAELNKIVQFLNENPAMHVEISGHTDNQGTTVYNLNLSENRAKTVAAYLSGNSAHPERISYIGYGEMQPIAGNDTEEGRSLNRRTELKIISE